MVTNQYAIVFYTLSLLSSVFPGVEAFFQFTLIDSNTSPSTENVSPVGSMFASSLGQCAGSCNSWSDGCHGFRFRPSTCSVTTLLNSGLCQMVMLSSTGTGFSKTSGCQRTYIKNDYLSANTSQYGISVHLSLHISSNQDTIPANSNSKLT